MERPVPPPRRAARRAAASATATPVDGVPDGVLRGPPLTRTLRNQSLGLFLLRSMQRHGDKDALVNAASGEATTYSALVRESARLAAALRLLLVEEAPGAQREAAVVAAFAENRSELVPSLVAALLLGMPVTMLNPLSNTGELVRAWTATRPCASLCSAATLPAVLEAARSLPSLRHVIVLPGGAQDTVVAEAGGPRVVQYADLLRGAPEDALGPDVAEHGDQRTAFLLQCGPGGRFARLTHRNLLYAVQLLLEPDCAGYGWTADDVLLLGAPLPHAFGLGMCLGALALGLKVVVMPHFREQLFVSAVQFHKVTQVVLVPRQAVLLAHSPLLEDAAVVGGLRGGLRGVVCAAAPLPRALHRDLTRRLAAPCRQAYGLTQASCSLLVAPRGAPPDSQGRVVPGAEAKVVDVSGGHRSGSPAPLGPMQVGELMLRAPSIMAGYLDAAHPADAGLGDAVDADGWLRTGDLAYHDGKGFVFVVDRLRGVTLYTRGHLRASEHGDLE